MERRQVAHRTQASGRVVEGGKAFAVAGRTTDVWDYDGKALRDKSLDDGVKSEDRLGLRPAVDQDHDWQRLRPARGPVHEHGDPFPVEAFHLCRFGGDQLFGSHLGRAVR